MQALKNSLEREGTNYIGPIRALSKGKELASGEKSWGVSPMVGLLPAAVSIHSKLGGMGV